MQKPVVKAKNKQTNHIRDLLLSRSVVLSHTHVKAPRKAPQITSKSLLLATSSRSAGICAFLLLSFNRWYKKDEWNRSTRQYLPGVEHVDKHT